MPRKLLYRRLWVAVTLLMWCGLGVLPSAAQRPQLKRPEEGSEEKPPEAKKKKKEKEPRAVGLLQLNSTGKGTLIPVAILIEGKFYDASIYKAEPVPMALEGGTVYEVEKTGESQGLFTVSGALHNNNPGSPTPWLGAGSYVLNGSEVAKKLHKAEDKPIGLDNDNDAPPRLTRGKGSASGDRGSGASTASAGTGSDTASQSNGKSTTSPTGTTQSSNGSSTSTGGASADKATTTTAPASSEKHGDSAAQAPPTGQSQSPPDTSKGTRSSTSPASTTQEAQNSQNYYRPTLRRGKPVETAPPDVGDEATTKADKAASTMGEGGKGPAGTLQAKVQLIPAISDDGGPEPRSYEFFWKEGEEDDRRKQMLALAADEVRAYVKAREKGAIPAKTLATTGVRVKAAAAGSKSTAKIDPIFDSIEFRAFDVWKNNQPVMVLTAEAHLEPAKGATKPPIVYDVSVAARTDIYGDLRKLHAGVTDKFHLDVTPKLELIDAVDADGDGRGELLFRETTDGGSGYVIYRPTGDTLWKMFDSLSAE